MVVPKRLTYLLIGDACLFINRKEVERMSVSFLQALRKVKLTPILVWCALWLRQTTLLPALWALKFRFVDL